MIFRGGVDAEQNFLESERMRSQKNEMIQSHNTATLHEHY